MTPEFHRELLELDEADAKIVLRVALSRVGKDDSEPGGIKARAIHELLQTYLRTGYPEQPFAGQVLREMRGDIDLRLQIIERASAGERGPVCTCNGGDLPLFDHHRMCELREGVSA